MSSALMDAPAHERRTGHRTPACVIRRGWRRLGTHATRSGRRPSRTTRHPGIAPARSQAHRPSRGDKKASSLPPGIGTRQGQRNVVTSTINAIAMMYAAINHWKRWPTQKLCSAKRSGSRSSSGRSCPTGESRRSLVCRAISNGNPVPRHALQMTTPSVKQEGQGTSSPSCVRYRPLPWQLLQATTPAVHIRQEEGMSILF
jgi:hypothetical protein